MPGDLGYFGPQEVSGPTSLGSEPHITPFEDPVRVQRYSVPLKVSSGPVGRAGGWSAGETTGAGALSCCGRCQVQQERHGHVAIETTAEAAKPWRLGAKDH